MNYYNLNIYHIFRIIITLTSFYDYSSVDPGTLQSVAFQNVFAIGDCANTPNAKTAAAICECH
jgi:hypothetical protein